MQNADVEYPINMLEQRKVRAVDILFLKFLTAVERHFLSVLKQTCMPRAVLTFELLLRGSVMTERWGQ